MIKPIVLRQFQKVINYVKKYAVPPFLFKQLDLISSNNKLMQMILMGEFKKKFKLDGVADFSDVQFRAFSQNEEDGILLYIFSLINMKSKIAVEICSGNGIECNAANLIINHGFTGLLIDGDKKKCEVSKKFYNSHQNTFCWPPTVVNSWVNKENVNKVIEKNGFAGEIDLLSIDMDGVDYWILKEISIVSPRVVVVEYQDILGPKDSITVPYSPDFQTSNKEKMGPNYSGASLRAFVKLLDEKGYDLVAIEKYGFNAFFVRKDENVFGVKTVDECFSHPKVQYGMKTRYPKVKDLDWEEV